MGNKNEVTNENLQILIKLLDNKVKNTIAQKTF